MKLEPIHVGLSGEVNPDEATIMVEGQVSIVTVEYDDGATQHVIFPAAIPAIVFAQALGRLHGDTRRMTKIIF